NPDSAHALFSRALVDYHSGRTQQAIEAMNQALGREPGDPQILLFRSAAFRDLGRPAEEEQGYRELIRLRPNFWPAYQELGVVFFRLNQLEAAADMYGQAAAAAPRVS